MENLTVVESTNTGDVLSNKESDDDDDENNEDFYIPSISDQLHAGFCRMDRACQTTASEIVDLKELSDVLSLLMEDLDSVRKSFYYAKLSLQSEYDGRLKEAVLKLYRRVNNRILEIEDAHKEHINVVRRSYRTQLANALVKLSRDYHMFYGNKDALSEASHSKKLKELQAQQKTQRMNEVAQQEMFEMLKMQMEETNAKVAEVPTRVESVISTSGFIKEIDELKDVIKEFENRVEYLEDMLEETNSDNSRMNTELEDMAEKLNQEEAKNLTLFENIAKLKERMEKEKRKAEEQLTAQREKLKAEAAQQLRDVRNRMNADAQKQLDKLKDTEAQKLRNQKFEEEKKLKDLMAKHEQEAKPVEIIVDADVATLQLIEKKQRAEIARLQRELERTVKMWELKVKVLQEQIHSLKDEMFLRTTMRRQTAKMKHATLTYVKKGSEVIPLGVAPTTNTPKLPRTYQLPAIIQAPKPRDDDEENTTGENLPITAS